MTEIREQQLQIEIVDGRLVISIGVELLTHAVTHGDDWEEEWEITDVDAFASAIAHQLELEEEDGTTLLHRAFDKAAYKAVEDGEDGVRLPGDDT